ncbi:SGNH/GDSL hydrolase family protein [Niabella drilacis]|uniref:Lysophospholipase L1 n=1 Tax=Niabella drilacis (strain DSM 25811 / CCM 8410 / CCUG 62505 / LMG 26954 / E90) TaxID=1285928 RepID=A0A1G6X002_NIADE|nr:SGNH/GDSL hydrolase family protein [Niabella drilacis]SDD71550.1 hypothetical protein SAMN04487894_11292 [Niabella drilacis]
MITKRFLIWPYLFLLLGSLSCVSDRGAVGRHRKIQRVVILGNSIVAHPPSEKIGWLHDWGMAASCRECDFVHLLKKDIQQKAPGATVVWGSIAAYENNYNTYDLSQVARYKDADLLIIKISENVKYEAGMEAGFIESFDKLVKALTPLNKTKIVIAEGFWPTPVNAMLRKYAQAHSLPHVPIEDLFANDKTNAAIGQFENEGVANHPSDKGMKNISDRIWNVIKNDF